MSLTEGRVHRLRERMSAQGLDALLVSSPANRRYLSGFKADDASYWSSAGWVLVAADRCLLLTGFNYYEEARQQAQTCEVVKVVGRLAEDAASVIKEASLRRVGIEPDYLSVAQHTDLISVLNAECELVAAPDLVEELRVVKEGDELDAIRRATAITDAAMLRAYEYIRPGVTEKQVAWELERYMRESGADRVAFSPAVAAGPNSAVPHSTPSDRPIGTGEPIFIDIGAQVDGYCSDLTRTICLAPANERFHEVYELVAVAQETALRGLRAGMTGQEADSLARQVITAAGYGEAFGHSLGHGVGLVVHERPRLSSNGTTPIPAGAVVTVEPGVYLPGWGGVRIEELVLVREEGAEVLTRAPKPVVVGG